MRHGEHKTRRRHPLTFDLAELPRSRQTLILACILFWSVLIYLFLSRLVITYTIVEGQSMAPAIRDGDRYFVHRWLYRIRSPQRGDIVAIQLPNYEDLTVKRVVALPYERVQIRDGVVLVNDESLAEPYLSRTTRTESGPLGKGVFRVDHDCYFVLGDNRDKSIDSRFFGAVHRDCIIGIAFD